jgi:hypothetical protein
MIDPSAKNKAALAIVREGVQDLLLYFMLGGLSILGEAVRVIEVAGVTTMRTDGRRIEYDPEWVLGVQQQKGMVYVTFDLLHEWLHIFFNHVLRRGDRTPHDWNVACDIIVVAEASRILTEALGRPVPPPNDGVIPPPWAQGKSAEEIYDIIHKTEATSGQAAKAQLLQSILPSGWTPDMDFESAAGYAAADEEEFHQTFVEELQQAALIQTKARGAKDLTGGLVGPTHRRALKPRELPPLGSHAERRRDRFARLRRSGLVEAEPQVLASDDPPFHARDSSQTALDRH